MSSAEWEILRVFRRYKVGPAEMLFLSAADCRTAANSFTAAMGRLIDKGMIIKERPVQAYSLTRAGYRLSRTAPAEETHRKKPRRRAAKA
jgi:hypothetical protein